MSVSAKPDTAAAAPSASARLPHRPEVDGLRALAILPILLLHAGVTGLRGGFVGVDVFFVISGYLITAIVRGEIEQGAFSLATFYRRRIVRILPALLVMIAVTLAAGCMILLPGPLRDLGHSAAAAGVFGANLWFYATTDYFAQSAELKPLVHTWSLAVEEQFYLFYPLLLLALKRLDRRALAKVLGALALLSFAVGGWQAWAAPTAGFYLLPARAWELLLGALVALGAFPAIPRPAWRNTLCWTALAGIVLSCIVTGTGWPFPVPFALPPAIGAALLLAYAPQTGAARLLSAAPLRLVGQMSYSLYLWHRPIIAYALTGRAVTMTAMDTALLLAASFAAAWLSWRFVEQPALRRWRSGKGWGVHRAVLAALALCLGAGLLVAAQAERIRPLPPQAARVAGYLGFEASPAGRAQFGTDRCFTIPTGKAFDPACLRADPARDTILLVGDSHAAQLSQGLRAALAPSRALMQATAAGCRPLLEGRGLRRCRRVVETAFHETDLSRVSTVVLAGRWFDADVQPLARTVRFLKAKGLRVVVVGPGVEYDADMPDVLARAIMAGDPQRVAGLQLADRAPLNRVMGPAVRAAGADYIDQFALECPQARCQLLSPDGAPLHIDHSHLAPWAAERVAEAIVARLRREN